MKSLKMYQIVKIVEISVMIEIIFWYDWLAQFFQNFDVTYCIPAT